MKVLIGITQSLEQTRDFITREYRETGSTAETGPFLSREEASRWEQFMIKRAEGCELLNLPQQPPEDIWYGYHPGMGSAMITDKPCHTSWSNSFYKFGVDDE